ncbi:MAG: hypothetical protein H6868_09330 [Rhodospirillales bacterium]|nr:hypothetical protein [Rhodospirillales bacterium]
MSGLVETYIVVSLLLAVFGAVTAMGSCLVFGVGMERLRAGFEVIKNQTGFFSDAIHKLEEKMVEVDKQVELTGSVVKTLENKVDVVDKQTSFFSDSIYRLEQKVEKIQEAPKVSEAPVVVRESRIQADRADALVSHAESLLTEVNQLAMKMKDANSNGLEVGARLSPSLSESLMLRKAADTTDEIRYH